MEDYKVKLFLMNIQKEVAFALGCKLHPGLESKVERRAPPLGGGGAFARSMQRRGAGGSECGE